MWCEGPKKEHEVYHIADGIITFIEKHADDSEMLSQLWVTSDLATSLQCIIYFFVQKKDPGQVCQKSPFSTTKALIRPIFQEKHKIPFTWHFHDFQ